MEKRLLGKRSDDFQPTHCSIIESVMEMCRKDWQMWIKPYDLNINEHHILTIAYHLKGASISEIAKFGVMHVSTAFNFSKSWKNAAILYSRKRR